MNKRASVKPGKDLHICQKALNNFLHQSGTSVGNTAIRTFILSVAEDYCAEKHYIQFPVNETKARVPRHPFQKN